MAGRGHGSRHSLLFVWVLYSSTRRKPADVGVRIGAKLEGAGHAHPRSGLAGPVAALNRWHKHGAVYTSYLLGTAYHGTEAARTVERLRASGARLLIVRRGSDDETFLLSRPDAAGDLDMVLFGRHPPMSEMPFRVSGESAVLRSTWSRKYAVKLVATAAVLTRGLEVLGLGSLLASRLRLLSGLASCCGARS